MLANKVEKKVDKLFKLICMANEGKIIQFMSAKLRIHLEAETFKISNVLRKQAGKI
jgi:hypothetical protein